MELSDLREVQQVWHNVLDT